jgi:hypothetical protein
MYRRDINKSRNPRQSALFVICQYDLSPLSTDLGSGGSPTVGSSPPPAQSKPTRVTPDRQSDLIRGAARSRGHPGDVEDRAAKGWVVIRVTGNATVENGWCDLGHVAIHHEKGHSGREPPIGGCR